eukprot:IDg664t1
MRDLIRVKRNEVFHKTDFFNFVTVMSEKATIIEETLLQRKQMEERDRNYDKSQTRCANEKRGSSNSGYARKSNSFKLESSKKRWKYSCLNPECKEHHKLYHKEQKRAMLLADSDNQQHSTLFSASFFNGAVETMVMADPGTDDNLLPPAVLTLLLEADLTLKVITLDKSWNSISLCKQELMVLKLNARAVVQ